MRDRLRAEKPPTSHLSWLKVGNFKSLHSVEVDLAQVNVFIGANGSGKSNLLEALGILGAAAAGIVDDQALLRRGVRPGVPELYKSAFAGKRRAPKIRIEAYTEDRDAYYSIFVTNPIQRPVPQWKFGNESLYVGGKPIATRGPRGDARVLGRAIPLENVRSVAALARARRDVPKGGRTLLARLDEFAIFAPVTPILRGIAPDPAPRAPVGLYGGQLPEAIAATAETMPDLLELALSIIDWASGIDVVAPTSEIVSPSVGTMRHIVRFTDRFMSEGRNVLSGYDASEGALYILFMLVLAMHPSSPKLLAIDNFDQALNPRTARALTRVFVEQTLAHRRQVLLTTHNPLVLDGLPLWDPRVRLFVVEREPSGPTRVRHVPIKDAERLKGEAEQLPLSRLWVTGRLGGVPDV